MKYSFTLPFLILQFFTMSVTMEEVQDKSTKGTCSILHQSIVCDTVNVTHVDDVKEILEKASSEFPNFGFICNHCNLQGFPEDILKTYNVTTFGFVPHEISPTNFPYINLLENINSKLTHLYLLASSVTQEDFQKLKEFSFGDGLKYLNLASNKLQALDSNTFAGWNYLEEINLSGNKISKVGQHTFEGLHYLKKLDLSKNSIALEEDSFSDIPTLTHLDLTSANISEIPKGAFANLKNLKSLNLRMNGFNTVEKETFNDENFPNIEELKLSAVPFFCECDLQWFKDWLIQRKLLQSSEATCILPIPLKTFADTNFCQDDQNEDVEIEDDDTDEIEDEDEDEDTDDTKESKEEL